MLKSFLKIAPFLFICKFAFAQSTGIKVLIVDSISKRAVPFANVLVEQRDRQIGGTTTDLEGNADIKPLDPGLYKVRIIYEGYKVRIIENYKVFIDSMSQLTVSMVRVIDTVNPLPVWASKDTATFDLAPERQFDEGERVIYPSDEINIGRCWMSGTFYKGDIERLPSDNLKYIQDFFPLSKLNGSYIR